MGKMDVISGPDIACVNQQEAQTNGESRLTSSKSLLYCLDNTDSFGHHKEFDFQSKKQIKEGSPRMELQVKK